MRSFFVVICACVLLISCNSKQVYKESVSFDGTEWTKDSVVRFDVEISDTTQTYDVVLSITNTDDYQYANLYLFTDIIMPSRQYFRDTVEFILSTSDGQWLGTGLSGYTNDFQYKSNIRFPEKGKYSFVFEQAMRCKNDDCCVNGIQSVSLSVKKK